MLYSGTVAAAIEGAFFGITSMAVSLQFDEHAHYDGAARLAREIIQQILAQKERRAATIEREYPDGGVTRSGRSLRRAHGRGAPRRQLWETRRSVGP